MKKTPAILIAFLLAILIFAVPLILSNKDTFRDTTPISAASDASEPESAVQSKPEPISEPESEPDSEPQPAPDPLEQKTSNGISLRTYVDRVIAIATAEPQYPVKNGKTKYGELFDNPGAAWCTEFVMYCLKSAETELGTAFIKDVYPWKDTAYGTGLWYKKRNRYYEADGSFVPTAGDIILFDTVHCGYPDHTGLAISSYEENGQWYVVTIEGNIPQDKVKQVRSRTLAINDPIIKAYCSTLVETPYTGSLSDYTR